MVEFFKQIFKEMFCKHYYEQVGELFGDQRNYHNGRYVYKCKNCGKVKYL